MDVGRAAQEMLDLIGALSIPAVGLSIVFPLRMASNIRSEEYSLDDVIETAAKVVGIFFLFAACVFLNAEWDNLHAVMQAHPGWGAYVSALAAVTMIVAAVVSVRYLRRRRRSYDIFSETDARVATPNLGRAIIITAGITWLAALALAIDWLHRISNR